MPPSKSKVVAASSRQVISRQLRSIIEARGETAYALGREAGVDPGMIQRLLNEERDIRLETLDRLAEVMGLRLVEGAKVRGRPAAKPSRGPGPARTTRPARLDRSPSADGQDLDEGTAEPALGTERAEDLNSPSTDEPTILGPAAAADLVDVPNDQEEAKPLEGLASATNHPPAALLSVDPPSAIAARPTGNDGFRFAADF